MISQSIVSQSIDNLQTKIIGLKQQHNLLKMSLVESNNNLKLLNIKFVNLSNAVKILQTTSDTKRDILRQRVESIVDKAIKGVFGSMYSFRLQAEITRGQMVIYPQIGRVINKKVIWDNINQCGGGVNDVVSFVMRVVILSLYKPNRERIIIADEPFKHVSLLHLPLIADVVYQLSNITGMQFFIVTHKPEITDIADKLYQIKMNKNGVSTATLIENG